MRGFDSFFCYHWKFFLVQSLYVKQRSLLSLHLAGTLAHPRTFRLMKGNFDAYLLWPLDKKVKNWIVDRSTTRDFTVCYEETLKNWSGWYFRYFGKTLTANDIPRVLMPALWKKICLESFSIKTNKWKTTSDISSCWKPHNLDKECMFWVHFPLQSKV